MKFCDDHWTRLREKIEEAGLGHLIAPDGETAALMMQREIERAVDAISADEAPGPQPPTQFEPLMNAHWAIVGNALDILGQAAPGAAMYVMQGDDVPEDPVEGFLGYEGKTWPRCPVCYLNLAHEVSCADRRCTLDKKAGYDWMLDRAVEDQVKRAAELREGEAA